MMLRGQDLRQRARRGKRRKAVPTIPLGERFVVVVRLGLATNPDTFLYCTWICFFRV